MSFFFNEPYDFGILIEQFFSQKPKKKTSIKFTINYLNAKIVFYQNYKIVIFQKLFSFFPFRLLKQRDWIKNFNRNKFKFVLIN